MLLTATWIEAWIYFGCISVLAAGARPQFDTSTYMGLVLVPADAEVDSVIFRLRATDQDADFPLIFDITAAVQPIVRVENLPCTLYNKVCQANVILTRRLVPGRLHDFAVRVRDSKGDSNSMQATISVTNATTPRDMIFPHVPSIIMVPEDAKPGKELDYLLVRANPWHGKPVYIELWQPKELFTIRQRQTPTQTRGVITLIGELDFETQSMYTLTMYATDPYTEVGKDTRNIAGVRVVVIVQDVQDVPPIFTIAPPLTRVNNSVKPGDVILRVHAEDGDKGTPREVTYGLVSEGNPLTPFFNISEWTGEIILARPLDELTKITHVGAPILLTVVAEEVRRSRDEPPGQATVVELGLLLGEAGNSPPYFESDSYVAWMDENAPPGTVVMFDHPYLAKVRDEDIGKTGVFALKLGNNNGTFEVSPTVAERVANFVVTVRDNTMMDYEARRTLEFTVIAQEVGPATNLSASAPVTIFLRDVNDNPPEFERDMYQVTIAENVPPGTRVIQVKFESPPIAPLHFYISFGLQRRFDTEFQVHASDKDTGLSGRVRYTGIIGPGNEAFSIDSETGLIVVTRGSGSALDRETSATLQLFIEARDEEGKGLLSTVPLTINLLDVNDNAPVFDKSVYEFVLNSEQTNFTIPAFIRAIDADAEPPNNEVRYELVHGNYGNKFYLDEVTGELILREPLNKSRRRRNNPYVNFAAKFRSDFLHTLSTFRKIGAPTDEPLRIWKNRKKRAVDDVVLYTLTVRAYDMGVPHRSNTAQVRVITATPMGALTLMLVVPSEHLDPLRTTETLASITGGRVTIQDVRPYNQSGQPGDNKGGRMSVVVARVEPTMSGTFLVDIEKIHQALAANGMGIVPPVNPDTDPPDGNSLGSPKENPVEENVINKEEKTETGNANGKGGSSTGVTVSGAEDGKGVDSPEGNRGVTVGTTGKGTVGGPGGVAADGTRETQGDDSGIGMAGHDKSGTAGGDDIVTAGHDKNGQKNGGQGDPTGGKNGGGKDGNGENISGGNGGRGQTSAEGSGTTAKSEVMENAGGTQIGTGKETIIGGGGSTGKDSSDSAAGGTGGGTDKGTAGDKTAGSIGGGGGGTPGGENTVDSGGIGGGINTGAIDGKAGGSAGSTSGGTGGNKGGLAGEAGKGSSVVGSAENGGNIGTGITAEHGSMESNANGKFNVVNKTSVVSENEYIVYKAENRLLLWLLILLGLLMALALLALILCCICPFCPFYMAPRKRRVHSFEVAHVSDNRPRRHLRRKQINAVQAEWSGKKQAWSADPMRQNWKFNRRNTKNRGLASLPGDVVAVETPQATTLRLRDGPPVWGIPRLTHKRQDDRLRVEDVEAGRTYDTEDIDSLRRHEVERGSDIPVRSLGRADETSRFTREQHFYRDGNAEVLRLVTRGHLEGDEVSPQAQRPTTLVSDQQILGYRTDGKDILLRRFIEDQKNRRHQDLHGSGQEMNGADGLEAKQYIRNHELILLPRNLDRERRQHREEREPSVQRLVIDHGDLDDAEEELRIRDQRFKDQEADLRQQRKFAAAMLVGTAASKATEQNTRALGGDPSGSSSHIPTYSIHDVELAKQNALLTQLLMDRDVRHVGVAGLDPGSYLETQSLPGQVAIATQTDRTAATQTEHFMHVRSRSDNDESEEEMRSRKKLKSKKRLGGEFRRSRSFRTRSPIEEETKSSIPRSNLLRHKSKDGREGRRATLEAEVLREISDSLDEQGTTPSPDGAKTKSANERRVRNSEDEDETQLSEFLARSSPDASKDKYHRRSHAKAETEETSKVRNTGSSGRKQSSPKRSKNKVQKTDAKSASSKKASHKNDERKESDVTSTDAGNSQMKTSEPRSSNGETESKTEDNKKSKISLISKSGIFKSTAEKTLKKVKSRESDEAPVKKRAILRHQKAKRISTESSELEEVPVRTTQSSVKSKLLKQTELLIGSSSKQDPVKEKETGDLKSGSSDIDPPKTSQLSERQSDSTASTEETEREKPKDMQISEKTGAIEENETQVNKDNDVAGVSEAALDQGKAELRQKLIELPNAMIMGKAFENDDVQKENDSHDDTKIASQEIPDKSQGTSLRINSEEEKEPIIVDDARINTTVKSKTSQPTDSVSSQKLLDIGWNISDKPQEIEPTNSGFEISTSRAQDELEPVTSKILETAEKNLEKPTEEMLTSISSDDQKKSAEDNTESPVEMKSKIVIERPNISEKPQEIEPTNSGFEISTSRAQDELEPVTSKMSETAEKNLENPTEEILTVISSEDQKKSAEDNIQSPEEMKSNIITEKVLEATEKTPNSELQEIDSHTPKPRDQVEPVKAQLVSGSKEIPPIDEDGNGTLGELPPASESQTAEGGVKAFDEEKQPETEPSVEETVKTPTQPEIAMQVSSESQSTPAEAEEEHPVQMTVKNAVIDSSNADQMEDNGHVIVEKTDNTEIVSNEKPDATEGASEEPQSLDGVGESAKVRDVSPPIAESTILASTETADEEKQPDITETKSESLKDSSDKETSSRQDPGGSEKQKPPSKSKEEVALDSSEQNQLSPDKSLPLENKSIDEESGSAGRRKETEPEKHRSPKKIMAKSPDRKSEEKNIVRTSDEENYPKTGSPSFYVLSTSSSAEGSGPDPETSREEPNPDSSISEKAIREPDIFHIPTTIETEEIRSEKEKIQEKSEVPSKSSNPEELRLGEWDSRQIPLTDISGEPLDNSQPYETPRHRSKNRRRSDHIANIETSFLTSGFMGEDKRTSESPLRQLVLSSDQDPQATRMERDQSPGTLTSRAEDYHSTPRLIAEEAIRSGLREIISSSDSTKKNSSGRISSKTSPENQSQRVSEIPRRRSVKDSALQTSGTTQSKRSTWDKSGSVAHSIKRTDEPQETVRQTSRPKTEPKGNRAPETDAHPARPRTQRGKSIDSRPQISQESSVPLREPRLGPAPRRSKTLERTKQAKPTTVEDVKSQDSDAPQAGGHMSRYKQKRMEMERRRREMKEAAEEEQRPRWQKKPVIIPPQLTQGSQSPKVEAAGRTKTPEGATPKTRRRIKPLQNAESDQLRAIVKEGRKLRRAEGGDSDDPPVEIFATEPPVKTQTSFHQPSYKYEQIPSPFYLHPPPPPPHSSPQVSPLHGAPLDPRRLDDDLDSGIAVSLQGGTKLRHQQMLEKKSVFDIAYSDAAPSQLRTDSTTPPS
ncbi:uncharacterized protein LOC105688571 isoform X2 [Athalia rosae]|uniref:uncharacterized protein LOC105688571 isoform X2 n=1 Tax=Athalia rosae TaxID=37344 RepID=UPI0020340106|nr:uncharacterized protein LOC105688571 isoform X2 [Athalia rosae]